MQKCSEEKPISALNRVKIVIIDYYMSTQSLTSSPNPFMINGVLPDAPNFVLREVERK